MKCPYCNKEMEQGRIHDRLQVRWQKDNSLFPKTVNLSKVGFFGGAAAVAYLCEDCQKVIVDYSDIEQE